MARATQRPRDPEIARELKRIGKETKRTREVRGLSQEEYAEKTGLAVSTVRNIEQGYDARVSAHFLNARHLGLPFGYGFSDDVTQQLAAIADRLHDIGERLGRLEGRQTSEASPDPCGSLIEWSQGSGNDNPPLPSEAIRRDKLYGE